MTTWVKRCAGIPLALLLLAGCTRTAPEHALRNATSGLLAAIEKRDASGLHGMLAEDFIGPEGLDRDGARRLAQAMFLRYRKVGAKIGALDVTLHDDQHGSVGFSAAVSGGEGGWLPESGQVYDVQTGWRMVDGEWRLVSAQWQPKLASR